MRITGGRSRGRILAPLKGWHIRPTSDKVREAIFNLIGQDMSGLKVLDLFAGTGSLGLETLSRGACSVMFVDHATQSIKMIKKNLEICGFEPAGHIIKKDLTIDLPKQHPMMKDHMDLVFIDPPYGKNLIKPILGGLFKREALKPSSIVVTESSKTDDLPTEVGNIHLFDTRIYGETKIDIYHCEESV